MTTKTINEAGEDKKTKVAEVERVGDKIRIPHNFSISDAINILRGKEEEEEQVIQVGRQFNAFIWDGCYALALALDKKFGWFEQKLTPGNFFVEEQPPAMYTVKKGPHESVQVPWGRFSVPGMKDKKSFLSTHFFQNQLTGMVCFALTGQIRRKYTVLFEELCKEVEIQLKTNSLYKGRAVAMQFRDSEGERMNFPEPSFPEIDPHAGEELVFSKHVEAAIEANLYTPIVKANECRRAGIPLKRGVGLAGPYGTGKTLIAARTANLGVQHGWTFIFCQSAADFCDCVRFAQQYQPAVVFCEDIDRVTDDQRDEQMDEILNTIDGVNSKGTEIMLVLTTNEMEHIHQAMLRPGRLDVVLVVERPDAEAVQRLIRQYGGKLLRDDEKLTEVGNLLSGYTPAVIREVVERSKLIALSMGEGGELQLTEAALVYSARTMKTQLELLNRPEAKDPHPMELFGNAVAKHLVAGVRRAAEENPEALRIFRGDEHLSLTGAGT